MVTTMFRREGGERSQATGASSGNDARFARRLPSGGRTGRLSVGHRRHDLRPFGFGLASFTAEIDLPRERAAFHAPLAACGHVRLVSPGAAEEYVPPIYERVALGDAGHVRERSSAWWQN